MMKIDRSDRKGNDEDKEARSGVGIGMNFTSDADRTALMMIMTMTMMINMKIMIITFRSSPSTPDTISVSAQEGQIAFTSTPDEKCICHNRKMYLLALTGALVVMMVYYISGSGNFFRFSLSPLMQLMLQVSL